MSLDRVREDCDVVGSALLALSDAESEDAFLALSRIREAITTHEKEDEEAKARFDALMQSHFDQSSARVGAENDLQELLEAAKRAIAVASVVGYYDEPSAEQAMEAHEALRQVIKNIEEGPNGRKIG